MIEWMNEWMNEWHGYDHLMICLVGLLVGMAWHRVAGYEPELDHSRSFALLHPAPTAVLRYCFDDYYTFRRVLAVL